MKLLNLKMTKLWNYIKKILNCTMNYQKERDSILADNKELHNQLNNIKAEYKEKEFDIEWNYKSKIKSLEKANIHLYTIIDKFHETVDKFIVWICHKFGIGESNEFVDPIKQIENEEKEIDLER